MRNWHRELVDVWVAALNEEHSGAEGVDGLIEWHRREQSVRREHARNLVDWHDALSRTLGRLIGGYSEQKPLLVREVEVTDRGRDLRETEAHERELAFIAWLDASRD